VTFEEQGSNESLRGDIRVGPCIALGLFDTLRTILRASRIYADRHRAWTFVTVPASTELPVFCAYIASVWSPGRRT
jgi:hypothetical protein